MSQTRARTTRAHTRFVTLFLRLLLKSLSLPPSLFLSLSLSISLLSLSPVPLHFWSFAHTLCSNLRAVAALHYPIYSRQTHLQPFSSAPSSSTTTSSSVAQSRSESSPAITVHADNSLCVGSSFALTIARCALHQPRCAVPRCAVPAPLNSQMFVASHS